MTFDLRWTSLIAAATLVAAASTATLTADVAGAAARTPAAKPVYGIGFEGPLSGANAQFGINEVNAVRLAITQANARGTLPFTLTLVQEDDEGDPAHSPAAAEALVTDPRVRAVVGPSFSGSTQATGDLYAQAGLGTVSPSASNPLLSGEGWRTFHRVIATDRLEPQLTAAWLHRRHVHELAVVWDRSSYGATTAAAITRRARALHLTVRRYTVPSSGRYGSIATSIAAHEPGAVYFAGYDTDAVKLARSLKARHYRGVKVGGNGMLDTLFTARSRSAGYGWYATCGCMTSYRTTAQKAFAAAYRNEFNESPGLYSAQAYDATNTIIRAISAAVAGGNSSRYWVNRALGQVQFTGISTRIRFTSHGDLSSTVARVNLFRDRRGRFAEVGSIRAAS